MILIKHITGILPENYTGNIRFNFNLNTKYKLLKIRLTYNNDKITVASDNLLNKIKEAYEAHYKTPFSNNYLPELLSRMKTELQFSVFLNREFVGTFHKTGNTKELIISDENSSNGCFCHNQIDGLLSIVISCYQVLCDHTEYVLEVYGEEDMKE